MSPAARAEVQRILDGMARRLLDERLAREAGSTNRSSAVGKRRSIETAKLGGRDARSG